MVPDKAHDPVWSPAQPEETPISRYRQHVNQKFQLDLHSSRHLHQWSVDKPQDFWIDVYGYLGVIPPLPSDIQYAYDESLPMSTIPPFFEDHKLNFAENVLSGRSPTAIAITGIRENGPLKGESWTWAQLSENIRRVANALRSHNVEQGDRVGAVMSNSPWCVALFLATATIGAIFTSISPEMGAQGIVARLVQTKPTILFADNSVNYNGKGRSVMTTVRAVAKELSPRPQIVIVPIAESSTSFQTLEEFLRSATIEPLRYNRVPFQHPLMILYSSGTSGPPKCLTHHHGSIIQFRKIAILHNSLDPRDVVFQYTSTSWVLFNIMIGHLSVGAPIICYDGSPFWPSPTILLEILEQHQVTYFGISPRWLHEVQTRGIVPKHQFNLSSLRMVTTTGSSLLADQFLWFYETWPSKIHLSSICGSTDIASTWIASDPAGPVFAGEIQLPALGLDIDVAHPETGKPLMSGEPGEMVCRKPFPSMPVYFWEDQNREKYRASYFEQFSDVDVWAQHDWLSINPMTGGSIIHGRSDGVLNPSGIRFGSADIYSIIEARPFDQIIENSLCVGRRRPKDTDESVFLFVVMRKGYRLDADLVRRIRDAVRTALSPRHVPTFIEEVKEIPVTINGKKMEIAVKQVISGKQVRLSATVANPKSLEQFARFAQVEKSSRSKL